MVMAGAENLSLEEAACLPEAFATAYLNLFIEGGAAAGDTLLMHAGASGLASVIIPMAKAFGLYVITSVLSADKKAAIAPLGADVVIDTSAESVPDALRREAEAGHPVDIAIDCLGDAMLGESLAWVNRGCRWIIIATLAGDTSVINMRTMYMKGIRLIGSTLRSKPPEKKAEILAALVNTVWPKIEAGPVKAHRLRRPAARKGRGGAAAAVRRQKRRQSRSPAPYESSITPPNVRRAVTASRRGPASRR